MYQHHFALARYPFESSLEADQMFPLPQQQEAGSRIRHLVDLRGIGLLTGEPGCGKTSVCRQVVAGLHPGVHLPLYVSLTSGSVSDLYDTLCHTFGLPSIPQRSRAFHTLRTEISRQVAEARRFPVLIVDEAHLLHRDLLEELRLLTNYRMDSDNRLCLLLSGLPELGRRLAMAAYESLQQRIVVRCHLDGMTPDQVEGYLQHRMKLAGAEVPLFREDTIRLLAQISNGVPRRIDRFAHLALMSAAAHQHQQVEPDDVHQAADESGP